MHENPHSATRLRHPLKRARGLGSAKDGTGHWIIQRVTAIALAFLSIYVVWLLLSLIGGDYATVHAKVADPVHATLLTAFLIARFWHAKLGMQVIIEDYVPQPVLATISHFANIFVCSLAAIAGVLAIVRIALGAA